MNGDVIKLGKIEIRYLVDGADKGGLGVFEMMLPAGSIVPPPHSHADNEECLYVLEGTLRYSVDDETRDLKAGDWMFTPRGSVHHFINKTAETVRALVMLTPDIGERYFVDVLSAIGPGGIPDRAKLIAVQSKYGVTPAAPR